MWYKSIHHQSISAYLYNVSMNDIEEIINRFDLLGDMKSRQMAV